ncbi:MAG: hypothetical protein EXQ87_02000 [Alphaproteobacteria bacterium]|nr:hypothetical protein [Alphaproteobacteria bacterium]
MSDLIGRIYDAATGAGGPWDSVLSEIACSVGAETVLLQVIDPARSQSEVIANLAMSEAALAAYARYYVQRDLWVTEAADMPLGRVLLSHTYVSEADWERSEFFNDFVIPFMGEPIFHCAGFQLALDDGTLVTFGAHRTRSVGRYGADEEAKLNLIMPHLHRALNLRARLRVMPETNDHSLAALDAMRVGVVVVDASGRPVLVNAAARAVLDRHDGLVLNRDRLAAGRTRRGASTI